MPRMTSSAQFDLYPNELSTTTVAAILIATHMSTHIVWGVTTFPQTWLCTLRYSYGMDGNGYVIMVMITSSSGERILYEDNMHFVLSHCAYMVGVSVFDPDHHTIAQCRSNYIPKDTSVSTYNF